MCLIKYELEKHLTNHQTIHGVNNLQGSTLNQMNQCRSQIMITGGYASATKSLLQSYNQIVRLQLLILTKKILKFLVNR